MSTERTIRLTPQLLALKLATREAVEAAGGQAFVAKEVDRTQSRISDYCSENTAEFMALNLVERVEALGAGAVGHPHITRALARARSVLVGGRRAGSTVGMDDLGDWLAAVAQDNAELAGALAGEDLSKGCDALSTEARKRIGREARELIDRLEQLCRSVDTS
jgi:hypothetical protein